jgi:hypothetical protein
LIKRKAIFGSLPVGRLQLRTSLVEIFLVIVLKMLLAFTDYKERK